MAMRQRPKLQRFPSFQSPYPGSGSFRHNLWIRGTGIFFEGVNLENRNESYSVFRFYCLADFLLSSKSNHHAWSVIFLRDLYAEKVITPGHLLNSDQPAPLQ